MTDDRGGRRDDAEGRRLAVGVGWSWNEGVAALLGGVSTYNGRATREDRLSGLASPACTSYLVPCFCLCLFRFLCSDMACLFMTGTSNSKA